MARRSSKSKHIGGLQLPMFDTPSEWQLPTEFPDLRRAKYIGIDTETRDPNLQKEGPGFIRGDAEVVGISLAIESGFKIYLPFGHETGPQLQRSKVLEYVGAQLKHDDQIKVFANAMYDIEALDSLGINPKGRVADIQVAEPLLDEERPGGFGLEALSQSYLGYGKSEGLLEEAANNWGLDKKRDLWRMDAKYSGEYAEDDALNPVRIIQLQLPQLYRQGLTKVWDLESELLPILYKMRKKGVAVDIPAAQALSKQVVEEENWLLDKIRTEVDYKVDPWSSSSLYELFDRLGLRHEVKFTAPSKNHPDGQPSFTNEFFKQAKDLHPVCAMLLEYRNTSKMRRDFIEGLIIAKNVNGRLHPQWHPMKAKDEDEDSENGTKTGRVASSKPNLTQIPSRHPIWGKKIRRLFVADKGGRWCKHDFSQQEPRITLHFGYLKKYEGAAEARQRYIDDPSTDYHDMTKDLILQRSGIVVERRVAKDINLGSAYGMGKYKLAAKLGLSVEAAEEILGIHRKGVPYVKLLEERCMEIVNGQGYIRTELGRKRRFDSWEAADWKKRGYSKPIRDYDEAVAMFGKVVRAYAHKALNAMVQGTAADQTKTAIVILHNEGLMPQIQVYDELNQTIYDDRAAWRIKEVMETALPSLTVPHAADPDVGASWGDVEPLLRAA